MPDPQPSDLTALLKRDGGAIVDEAAGALDRWHLRHYDAVGPDERRRRLRSLFDVVVTALRDRDLMPVHKYAEVVARERFDTGVDISEVQTAMNVLEEILWHRVVAGVGHDDMAEAIGLVSTVLGAGKDSLARTYVSLATQRRVSSLDLSALFQGAG